MVDENAVHNRYGEGDDCAATDDKKKKNIICDVLNTESVSPLASCAVFTKLHLLPF
jgi:hypothetical protein